jgi:hypothetical protein
METPYDVSGLSSENAGAMREYNPESTNILPVNLTCKVKRLNALTKRYSREGGSPESCESGCPPEAGMTTSLKRLFL